MEYREDIETKKVSIRDIQGLKNDTHKEKIK